MNSLFIVFFYKFKLLKLKPIACIHILDTSSVPSRLISICFKRKTNSMLNKTKTNEIVQYQRQVRETDVVHRKRAHRIQFRLKGMHSILGNAFEPHMYL